MFDPARVREILVERRGRGVGLAAAAFAAATLVLIGAGPAAVAASASGADKQGGVVYNRTDMTMRVAELAGSWRCGVYLWPWSFRPDDQPCKWKRLPPGASSRSYYPDADAFRFDWDGQDFMYTASGIGTRHVGTRIYMKIRDPQKVVCTRAKGFPPYCVG